MTLMEALEREGITAAERTQGIDVKVWNPPSASYTTGDELTFLRGLLSGSARSSNGTSVTNGWAGRGANPEAFRKYAGLVMSGMRRYPDNVDVARVRAEIVKLMPELGRQERVTAMPSEAA